MSDLISRSDAIGAVKEERFPIDSDYAEGFMAALDKVEWILKEWLPSAQPDLLDDGTILMTVPHGILSDVKRVLVDEVGTKNCKVMYQDDPERKKGRWEEKHHAYADEEKVIEEWQSCKCSVCGRYDTRPYMYYFDEPHFCSWCGADMRGKQDG